MHFLKFFLVGPPYLFNLYSTLKLFDKHFLERKHIPMAGHYSLMTWRKKKKAGAVHVISTCLIFFCYPLQHMPFN